jgi:hypothetical protein
MLKKQFNVKVFDKDGVFVHTYSPDIVTNDPRFSHEMNDGYGECTLFLSEPFDDFDEGVKVAFENIVKIYEFDANNPNGRLIYTGVCTQYRPTAEEANQFVEMNLVGLIQFFSRAKFTSGGSYTVNYTGGNVADPADMIKDVIDNLLVDYPNSGISYSGGNIDDLGATISHEFVERSWRQSVNSAFGFMGAGRWWKLAEDGQFWLKEKPVTATHTFEFSKHIDEAVVNKNSESVINKIHLKYSGGSVDVSDAGSITAYGKREEIITDTRISNVTTATNKANQILDANKDEKISAKITLNSSYDLESVKAGETCKILGLKKDSQLFNDNMQILRVDYKVDTITIHLEEVTRVFGTELEDFTNNQINQ